MKPKQIIILGIILGLLAFGILLKSWARSASDRASSAQKSDVVIAEFDPEKVDRVLITNGTHAPSVELVKEQGIWKVKSLWNAKADPAGVETLIRQLHSVRGELRGSGKKLFPDFGIQNADAFSIKFLDAGNGPLADLRIGKKRVGEEGYFIRKATGEEVYLVGLNMAELLGIHAGLDEAAPLSGVWADLRLFNLDPEKVTKITLYHLQGEEKTMITGLERKADLRDPLKSFWKFLRKDMSLSLDPDKVLKFISVMNSVRAQKVVDPVGKEYGLEKPAWQLAVREGDKKTILNAGPKAGKGDLYYAKTSSDGTVFGLNAGHFDDLNVDDTHFVKDVPPVAGHEKSP